MNMPDRLSVWWLATPTNPVRIGTVSLSRGNSQCRLEVDPAVIQDVTPEAMLKGGLVLPYGQDGLPYALDDCAPDRWGRLVIQKLERPPRLSPLDFLYLAGDERFGALGFSIEQDQYIPYDKNPALSLGGLSEVERLIEMLQRGAAMDERERRLIKPSKTLGGARPKTHLEIDGQGWIAKFPQADDVLDISMLEFAANRLQQLAGIQTAEADIKPLPKGTLFLTKRFDRENGQRIQAISARTMIVSQRHQSADLYSYLDLAGGLRQHSSAPVDDCAELFRRMVFNVLLDNTDDHEKNHALLRRDGVWRLAPSFDALPQLSNLGAQAMLIGGKGTEASIENLRSKCEVFLLDKAAADRVINEIAAVIGQWESVFEQAGVTGVDMDLLRLTLNGERLLGLRKPAI